MTSASYESMATVGKLSPTGAASICNSGDRTTVGFWSLLGHAPVPIVLAAMRDASDPTGTVNLEWTGAVSVFQVYRSFDAEGILAPNNLDHETPNCSTTDANAFQSDHVFYKVIPTPDDRLDIVRRGCFREPGSRREICTWERADMGPCPPMRG